MIHVVVLQSGSPFPDPRARAVLCILGLVFTTAACKPSPEQRHREVLASIDVSTVAGAAKSLCTALNDGSADVVAAVLNGDYWQAAAKACVSGECLALVQRYQSCPDKPTWKDFPQCAPTDLEKSFLKFVAAVRQRGHQCKQVKLEDDTTVVLEVIPGVHDKVRFKRGSRGFHPDPDNTLLDSRIASGKQELADALNKKPAEKTK